MTDWGVGGSLERNWYRTHNVVGRVTLTLVDDTRPMQSHQIEGYSTELRPSAQRVQLFGISSVPLSGGRGVAVYQSGHRGFPTVVADEDPRYRPTNQKPGCVTIYMVDGAKSDGTGGTMRTLLAGALGWACALFGKTIAIGDSTNTTSVTIYGSNSIKLVGNVEITGNLTVDGKTTTVQDIIIKGVETDSGST